MPISKNCVLTAVLSLISAFSFAQDVNDILNKNIEAMGGKDKLSKLLTVYEETTTSVMGNDVTAKMWVVNGQAMRAEAEIMGSTIITVVTRDSGWMINPMAGGKSPQPIPMDQIKQSAARIDLRGQFLNYKANGYTATLAGKETVDGKDSYKVKLSKARDQDLMFYIDAATWYVIKLVTTVKVNGSEVTSEVTLSDYKKTLEGYWFPYTTSMVNSVAPGSTIRSTVTKVVANQTIDPKLFQKP